MCFAFPLTHGAPQPVRSYSVMSIAINAKQLRVFARDIAIGILYNEIVCVESTIIIYNPAIRIGLLSG